MATIAKPKHREARALYLGHLDIHPGKTVNNDLDPLEAGIVGDSEHGSGYHLSRQDNDADDYSVDESSRDRRGRSDYASATDIGYFKVTTRRGTFDLYDYNAWLIGLCNAGDPDTADLREVIYSLDGRTVKRWDRLKRRSGGESSHRTHTHKSEFRDATGQRMVNLARRWLQHIGLLAGEDDDVSAADVWAAKVGSGDNRTRMDSVVVAGSNAAVKTLAEVVALRSVVETMAQLLQSGGGDVDTVAILRGVDDRVTRAVTEVTASTRDAVADLGEGGAEQVRAG